MFVLLRRELINIFIYSHPFMQCSHRNQIFTVAAHFVPQTYLFTFIPIFLEIRCPFLSSWFYSYLFYLYYGFRTIEPSLMTLEAFHSIPPLLRDESNPYHTVSCSSRYKSSALERQHIRSGVK